MNLPYATLQAYIDQYHEIAARYMDDNSFGKNKKTIVDEFDNKTLQIMLYGAYNSGKSSLINLLMAENVAPVDDIPKTDSVNEYSWQGYRLIDTPGVNAPIKHEKITDNQLKKTNAILFVIRDGDMDSKDLYDRLFDLIKRNKKIFVVLNHELSSDADKDQSLKRVLGILCDLAPKYEVGLDSVRELSVIMVNIKTAIKAQNDLKEKLLERSGYLELKSFFSHWAKQQDNESSHLKSLCNAVDEVLFAPLAKILNDRISENESNDLLVLRDSVRQLKFEKTSIKNEISRAISEKVFSKRSDVKGLIEDIISSGGDIQTGISNLFSGVVSEVQELLSVRIEAASIDFTSKFASRVPESTQGESNPLLDKIADQVKDKLSDQETVKQGFMLLRGMKFPGLKGRWEKTLGDWAGKAAGVLKILFVLYDMYRANEDENKANKEARLAAIELNQMVEEICVNVQGQIRINCDEIIESNFNGLIDTIQNQIDEAVEGESEVIKDQQLILDLRNEIVGISF